MITREQESLLRSLMKMGEVIEARDPYTGGHVWRITQMAKRLAQAAAAGSDLVLKVTIGGWLHDLGKIAIPDAILNKRGRLTPDQAAIMKQHPLIGRDILIDHPLADLAMNSVAHHHERFDGAGYPDGLAGEAIPSEARYVAIADAFDAMTSVRPYSHPRTPSTALSILHGERGQQFDPELVDIFANMVEAGGLDDVVGHFDMGRSVMICPTCGPVVTDDCANSERGMCTCDVCEGVFVVNDGVLTRAAGPGTRKTAPLHPNRSRIDREIQGLCQLGEDPPSPAEDGGSTPPNLN